MSRNTIYGRLSTGRPESSSAAEKVRIYVKFELGMR